MPKYNKTEDFSSYIPKSQLETKIDQKSNGNRFEEKNSNSEESDNRSIIFLSDKSSSTDDEDNDHSTQIFNVSSEKTNKILMLKNFLNDCSDNKQTRKRRNESDNEVTCDSKITKYQQYHYTQEEIDNEIKINPYEEIERIDEDAETLPTIIDSKGESPVRNFKLPIQSTTCYNSSSAYPQQYSLNPNLSIEEETFVSVSSFKSQQMTEEEIEKLK
ncbi:hypothetical protein SNEBB_010846 [Seison nebaliae]|nr:hypothetical protein SNEBB_010846 [Seison nebaliae]